MSERIFKKMICPEHDDGDCCLIEYVGPKGKYTAASCVKEEFADLFMLAPEMLAMLERLEWRAVANEDFDGDICSLCGGISHKPDCELAALIKRAKSLTGQ